MSSRRAIAGPAVAASCYFRTSTIAPERKALVQITERCNLHCAHCFVSAIREGIDIARETIRDLVLPRLAEARVRRLTLTGGEPFAHPDVVDIVRDVRAQDMTVTLCTNATLIDNEAIDLFAELGGIRLNVSLDGFSRESHTKRVRRPAKDTYPELNKALLEGWCRIPCTSERRPPRGHCSRRRRRIGPWPIAGLTRLATRL